MTTVTFSLSESGGKLVSTPESQAVTQPNTTLQFELVGQAANDYRITGYTSNDTMSQLGVASINKAGTQMLIADANSKQEDINVTVLTAHRTQGTVHQTDPVVLNRPPV